MKREEPFPIIQVRFKDTGIEVELVNWESRVIKAIDVEKIPVLVQRELMRRRAAIATELQQEQLNDAGRTSSSGQVSPGAEGQA